MARKKIEMNSSVASAVKGAIEERKDGQQQTAPVDDVLVALGNLSDAQMKDITFGKNYEAIALDYIETFNGAVTQGIAPLKALCAMTQATSIVMGNCLRAGLKKEIALGLLMKMVEHAKGSSEQVQIITKQ